MPIVFKKVHAQLAGTEDTYIIFEIEDISEDPSRYIFEVYRAKAITDDWAKIASLTDQFGYIDRDVYQSTDSYLNLYKVSAIDTLGAEPEVESQIVTVNQSTVNAIASTLKQKYDRALGVSGTLGFFFQLRKGGFRCQICWNPVTKAPMKSNCSACAGTSYANGFYRPYKMNAQFSWRSKRHDDQVGLNDFTPTSVIMGPAPIANVGDVLYDAVHNRMLEVRNGDPYEFAGTIYAQRLTCSQIESSHVVFKKAISEIGEEELKKAMYVYQRSASL